MMMTCCLMVYAGLEHKIRTGLYYFGARQGHVNSQNL